MILETLTTLNCQNLKHRCSTSINKQHDSLPNDFIKMLHFNELFVQQPYIIFVFLNSKGGKGGLIVNTASLAGIGPGRWHLFVDSCLLGKRYINYWFRIHFLDSP